MKLLANNFNMKKTNFSQFNANPNENTVRKMEETDSKLLSKIDKKSVSNNAKIPSQIKSVKEIKNSILIKKDNDGFVSNSILTSNKLLQEFKSIQMKSYLEIAAHKKK